MRSYERLSWGLTEVEIDNIHCSPLIFQASQNDFPFLNSCWLLSFTFSSFMYLKMVSRITYSITFSGIKVLLTGSEFPSFLLSLLKIWNIHVYVFPPVLKHLSQSPWELKIIKGDLTMTSVSSLSSQGCIPSGPWTYLCSVGWSIPWPDSDNKGMSPMLTGISGGWSC